jgi:hypothetical protein
MSSYAYPRVYVLDLTSPVQTIIEVAAQVAYIHLGDTKSRPEVTSRLERRMPELDPACDRHCQRAAQTKSARA